MFDSYAVSMDDLLLKDDKTLEVLNIRSGIQNFLIINVENELRNSYKIRCILGKFTIAHAHTTRGSACNLTRITYLPKLECEPTGLSTHCQQPKNKAIYIYGQKMHVIKLIVLLNVVYLSTNSMFYCFLLSREKTLCTKRIRGAECYKCVNKHQTAVLRETRPLHTGNTWVGQRWWTTKERTDTLATKANTTWVVRS